MKKGFFGLFSLILTKKDILMQFDLIPLDLLCFCGHFTGTLGVLHDCERVLQVVKSARFPLERRDSKKQEVVDGSSLVISCGLI